MGADIFNIGVQAMLASQAQLDTTSNNISNVNTPGYSVEHAVLQTAPGLFTGAGFFGEGVQVTTISRNSDSFLTQENNVNQATNSANQTRLTNLNALQNVFPTGSTNGVGAAATQMLNDFVNVANDPTDMSARQVVLSDAQSFVAQANSAGKQIDALQAGVVSGMTTTVTQVNSLLSQIATTNSSIAQVNGNGQAPNQLLDQRDQLVAQLNQLVQVNQVPGDNGQVNLFTPGGQSLVLDGQSSSLSVVRDPTNSAQGRVALNEGGTSRILDSSQFTGGSLGGMFEFQDTDIVNAQTDLNSFVSQFATALNTQQSLGMDANGNLQTSFDASGNPVGTPIFNNVSTADGISVNLTSPASLAAANPLSASAPSTNTGTATVTSLTMNRALPTGTAPDAGTSLPTSGSPLTVVFSTDPSNASNMLYKFVDSSGNEYKPLTPERVWTPGSAINDADPGATPATALFNIQISGAPKAGDTLTIAVNQSPAQDNSNAEAFLGLRDQNIIALNGNSPTTLTDAYSELIGNVGVTVQNAKTQANISSSVSQSSQQSLSNETGVNLDEEASHLIQYQQSYQAAAKVLQVAQTIFSTLLSTAAANG